MFCTLKQVSCDVTEDLGYTMVHLESGEVVVQHLPRKSEMETKKEEKNIKRRTNSMKLVYCKPFTKEYCAPFSVEMDIFTFFLVDIHSIASPNHEVIGLLGGAYDEKHNVLSISTAVPCKTTLSNRVHCDMCPVSEYEGSQKITKDELSVVGWYHSHPDFPPHPSDTDLETQFSWQTCFEKTQKAFVGFILTPCSQNASTFRCIAVNKVNNDLTPFQFHVKLCFRNVDLKLLKTALEQVFTTLGANIVTNHLSKMFIKKCKRSITYHLKTVIPKLEGQIIEQLVHDVENILTSIKQSVKNKKYV